MVDVQDEIQQIAQVAQFWWYRTAQLVDVQDEIQQIAQVAKFRRYRAAQLVAEQDETLQTAQIVFLTIENVSKRSSKMSAS